MDREEIEVHKHAVKNEANIQSYQMASSAESGKVNQTLLWDWLPELSQRAGV